METILITQETDPIILQRMAVRERVKRVRELSVLALESKPEFYTRKMLYELAIQQKIIDINSYTMFMRDLKELEDDREIPIELLKCDKKADRTPDLFQPSHVRNMLRVFYEEKSLSMSIAFLLGMRECMRLGEVARLQWRDISFEGKFIVIRDSKWRYRSQTRHNEGKTAPIPLFTDVAEILLKYKEYCNVVKDTEYLFPSPKNPSTHILPKTLFERFAHVLKAVGLRGQEQILYQYHESKGNKSGIKKNKYRYYFHTTRHFGACYWLRKTKQIEFIKILLRHRDVQTTEVYARLTTDELKKTFEDAERSKYHQIKQQLNMDEQQELLNKIIKQEQEIQVQALSDKHKLRSEELDKMSALKDKEIELLRMQCKAKELGVTPSF